MSARIWRFFHGCVSGDGEALAADDIPLRKSPFRFGGRVRAELGKREGIGYHNMILKRQYAFLFDIHKESPWR
ncbi:MAG: hypothetical protein IKA58_05370, partial [Clostridia bacterium]|nr:hypothetical protein [Clostridia bacterium]